MWPPSRATSIEHVPSLTPPPASSRFGSRISPELVLIDPELARVLRNEPTPLPEEERIVSEVTPNEPPVVTANGHAPQPVDQHAQTTPAAFAQPAAPAAPAIETILLEAGMITVDQLTEVVRARIATGRPSEELVLERGFVAPADLERLLGRPVAPAEQARPTPAPVSEQPVPVPGLEEAARAVPLSAEAVAAEPLEAQPTAAEPLQAQPAAAEPPAAEAVAPAAVAAQVAAAPEPPAAPIAAESETATERPASPAAAPVVELAFRLLLHLDTGRTLEADLIGTRAEAERRADELVGQIAASAPPWVTVAGARVRAENVVAVELRPELHPPSAAS
jgi:hypothetical protein